MGGKKNNGNESSRNGVSSSQNKVKCSSGDASLITWASGRSGKLEDSNTPL